MARSGLACRHWRADRLREEHELHPAEQGLAALAAAGAASRLVVAAPHVVYGRRIIKADASLAPSPYGTSKAEAEASVITAADKGVIVAVCLRVLNAAEALGVGKAALRRAVGYAATRVVFGRPTGANRGISLLLAEAHARLTAAELAIWRAAWRIDQRPTVRRAT